MIDTLSHRLENWAAIRSSIPAAGFLDRGETLRDERSFAALAERARAIGAALTELGLAGRTVMLCFPAGLEFIDFIFGCIYSGVIAVPVPYPLQPNAFDRLVHIARAAEAAAILVPAGAPELPAFRAAFADFPSLRLLPADHVDLSRGADFVPIRPRADQPAFLQFTSGSTGQPKGVIVSHGNIAANMEMIRAAFGHDDRSRFFSWLPMFHDMGLVGMVLQPVWLGVPARYMSPYAFLQKPTRWLRAISEFGATTSGAPNFAFDLVARQAASGLPEALDLSSWSVAYCGAEPVRAASLAAFADRLGPAGFDRRALFPCYGMAEATLFVSGGPVGGGVRLLAEGADVSCGSVLPPGQARIVDPASGEPLPDGVRGELWLAGPHVTAGYWNDPDATAAAMKRTSEGTVWLRTGDLATRRDGEIAIVGRIKDMVIIRGVNYAAEEIEAALCQGDPAFAGATTAAFNSDDALVILIEMRLRNGQEPNFAALARSASTAVIRSHGIKPDSIAFVRNGRLARTTSGKVRRHAVRQAWESGVPAADLLYATG